MIQANFKRWQKPILKGAAIEGNDLAMRAPQYGHNRGKRRGLNPFSRPWVRFVAVRAGRGRVWRKRLPVALPKPVVHGSVTVKAPNVKMRMLLWHKNVSILARRGKRPNLANPCISKDVVVPEPPRILCAIPSRERPKSRNDTNRFWLARPGRPGKSHRTGAFTLRKPQ